MKTDISENELTRILLALKAAKPRVKVTDRKNIETAIDIVETRQKFLKNSTKRETQNSFVQGYACALATFVRGHGEHTAINEGLRAVGLHTLTDARKAKIEPYDLEVLSPVIKDNQIRDKAHKKFCEEKLNS